MTTVTKQGCFVENKILDRVLRAFGVINVFKGTAAIIQRSGTFHGIFGPGLHTAPWYDGYKVTDILSLDMHLFENAMPALTKDRIPVIVEGFIQYRVVEKSAFDSAGISEVLREAFEPVIHLQLLEMDFVSAYKHKKVLETCVEGFLEEIGYAWGIGDCRVFVVNIERYDPIKDALKIVWIKKRVMKWTRAIEAFRLRGEPKKRGKAKKIQPIEDPRRGSFLGQKQKSLIY